MNMFRIFPVFVSCVAFLFAGGPAFAALQDGTTGGANEINQAVVEDFSRLSADELQKRKDWQAAMGNIRPPADGCFGAAYPNRNWREVSCVAARPYPMPPRKGPRPLVVGNGDDIAAGAPSGFISTAIGSFDSVTGVTSVSSPNGSGSPVANAYSLQINTEFFNSTACAGSPNTGCRGWEQFVLSNDGSNGLTFIQYWLIRYDATCPTGWNQFSFTGTPTEIYCFRNSSAVSVPNQPVGNLGQLTLTGAVAAGSDSVTLSTGSNLYTTAGIDAVNAAAGWRAAEFNIFGNGGNSSGGGEATFNAGSTIVPRTRIFYGGTAAPNCLAQGFTGETNNLSFGPTPPAATAPGPAVLFTESSAGGATSNCAAAATIGDTHLGTFHGLFYDFQASGDFVIAEVDPGFVVQARQVSGAPTWPNASVNSAVATQMSESKITICLGKAGLNIDGERVDMGRQQTVSLPDGVDITRRGNVYVVTDQSGNSITATVHSKWINVSVGLGQWPSNVRGLLANANGNVNQLQTRSGTVLTSPFSFDDLYTSYADSWRVPAKDSLLNACGGGADIASTIPDQPFYAKHLDTETYERTRAVCLEAGVQAGPLLNACTLDVAVIGDDTAANVFVTARAPVLEGIITASDGSKIGGKGLCDLLVALLLIGSILLALLGRSSSGPIHLFKWLLVLLSWAFAVYYLGVRLGLI